MDAKELELEQKLDQGKTEITISQKLIEGSISELDTKQRAIDVMEWQKNIIETQRKRIIYLEDKIREVPWACDAEILQDWYNSIEGI